RDRGDPQHPDSRRAASRRRAAAEEESGPPPEEAVIAANAPSRRASIYSYRAGGSATSADASSGQTSEPRKLFTSATSGSTRPRNDARTLSSIVLRALLDVNPRR